MFLSIGDSHHGILVQTAHWALTRQEAYWASCVGVVPGVVIEKCFATLSFGRAKSYCNVIHHSFQQAITDRDVLLTCPIGPKGMFSGMVMWNLWCLRYSWEVQRAATESPRFLFTCSGSADWMYSCAGHPKTYTLIKLYFKLTLWINITHSSPNSILPCNMLYRWNDCCATASIMVGSALSSFSTPLNLRCFLWLHLYSPKWMEFYLQQDMSLNFFVFLFFYFPMPFLQVIWIWLVKSKSSKQRTIPGWPL